MKVLLLADTNSIHTKRWAISLSNSGVELAIFGLSNCNHNQFEQNGIKVFSGKTNANSRINEFQKIAYLKVLKKLKKAFTEFDPDIVHAHYATSYGYLGRKLKSKKLIISVWGSDIYQFPKKSFAHRMFLKKNLAKAKLILSTSEAMADEVMKYAAKRPIVTPFGIDVDIFKPAAKQASKYITIGSVKTLEEIYGLEYLIRAFQKLVTIEKDKTFKLVIAGTGSLEKNLKALCTELQIIKQVDFLGFVEHDKIPQLLNTFDIYVALSLEESFGVAILEASSCGIPVVVSDADGLKEVVEEAHTGFIVPRKNIDKATDAILKIVKDSKLKEQMSINARKHVVQNYNWNNNVKQMLKIYDDFTKSLP